MKSEKFYELISNKNIITGTIKDVIEKSNSEEILLNIKGETENTFNIKIITNNIPKYNFGETISVEGKISTSSVILPLLPTSNVSMDTENLNKLNNID